MSILNRLFALSRNAKLLLALVWDFLALTFALFCGYWIRLGISNEHITREEIILLGSTLFFTLLVLTLLGHYRHIIRYIGLKAATVMFAAITLGAVYMVLVSVPLQAFLPVSVPFIFWVFATILLGGPRFLIYIVVQSHGYRLREKCLIFGAAETGRSLAQSLKQNSDLLPVAFIDDKQKYRGRQVLGLEVKPRSKIPELIKKHNVKKVLLAVPNTSMARRKELIAELEPYALELLTIPDMKDLVSGERKISELQEIRIEELLGREPVPAIDSLLTPNITGKRVMVTGAGGSIGSELCRQIIKAAPESIVLFEISEFNLYQIENELRTQYPDVPLYPVLGTIQDSEVIREALAKFKIQTIYHAAAYKHVPMVECNIMMGIRNNIFGTANVALIAAEFEVEKFVLVSTDKAVRPTNVMGATKRFAELYVQSIAELGSKTEYAIVRFGNVLGSSGSVVPLFTKQIENGGPITVTHPDIIRYFMTIPEASQLVIQAGCMGKAGEVFVLDMGDPVKIVDLATKMAHLMGHSIRTEENPGGDIEIQFSGLRPGEKLYEELLIDDADTQTEHPRIMGANEFRLPFDEVVMLLDKLNYALIQRDEVKARQILIDGPLAYTPATH
ncbi:nucleoside-diphosphate sugar epimerase/dehydratase [Alteromonadaceae bacterium BrNp21-10]|nr:nucleoside-diphosphate sugar epimerase/dehydratase [Alteromonadaceae bacterium BrNp21-10]